MKCEREVPIPHYSTYPCEPEHAFNYFTDSTPNNFAGKRPILCGLKEWLVNRKHFFPRMTATV